MPIQKMKEAMYSPHTCGLSMLATPMPVLYWYTSQPMPTPNTSSATKIMTQYSLRGILQALEHILC